MSLPNDLQSAETDVILNTIDELRQLGAGSILELPQIIVCGDQSSGKSSVLNAVSGLKFPTKDGLCTRFATEVIMRQGSPEHIRVAIVPGPRRTHDEKLQLQGFTRSIVSMDDIENLIDQATATMGIAPEDPKAKRFSDDILRFEVTGPNQPSLTLVDLPGLFQAPNRNQTEEDTESVKNLVLQYMKNKRSVILAVISAKSEFVLQSVTKHSRKVDPRGERTLGIITKPDKLDEGSQSERQFIDLAQNRQAFLHLGWHVLVNRDHHTRDYTQAQRDDAEKQYLSRGVWAALPNNHKGVFTLRTRLSVILREQILNELPHLIKEAENLVVDCTSSLSRLGASRATAEDRRRYLIQAAHTYNITMRSSINGAYDDNFFNSDGKSDENQKRLRAVIQNTLMQYSDEMHELGHESHIVDDRSDDEDVSDDETVQHPRKITQTAFENRVMKLMKHARGCELMGTYNPMIVRELFLIQSKPWDALTEGYRSKIFKSAQETIDLALAHATDNNTKLQLEKHIIKPALDQLVISLEQMIQKLLMPRHESHPITYNRRLAESLQKSKQNFAERMFSEAYGRSMSKHGEVVSKDFLEWLFKEQVVVPTAHLNRFAASETIDAMRAYYKVSSSL